MSGEDEVGGSKILDAQQALDERGRVVMADAQQAAADHLSPGAYLRRLVMAHVERKRRDRGA